MLSQLALTLSTCLRIIPSCGCSFSAFQWVIFYRLLYDRVTLSMDGQGHSFLSPCRLGSCLYIVTQLICTTSSIRKTITSPYQRAIKSFCIGYMCYNILISGTWLPNSAEHLTDKPAYSPIRCQFAFLYTHTRDTVGKIISSPF